MRNWSAIVPLFLCWLAVQAAGGEPDRVGAGIKGGTSHGETGEIGEVDPPRK